MESILIIHNKVREDKLVRVEPEGCNREGKNGYPEIDQVRGPECQCHVEEHDECPHAQVNTWTSKTGEEDVEVDTGCCKSTACRNVTRASECEISEDWMSVDLHRKHFEDEWQGGELFHETPDGFPSTTFDKF